MFIKNRPTICADLINSQLSNFYHVYPIFETIDSTNTYLKEHDEMFKHGSIIIAKHQSSGRGRFDRLFESNNDCGIYCSFLLKDDLEVLSSNLNLRIACALHNSIYECFGINTQIKWPNDLIIDQKKCAGILIETNYHMTLNRLDSIIIGWGLNVYNQSFNESIKNLATTLESYTDIDLNRNELLIHFFNHLDDFLYKTDFIDYYKKHMLPIDYWVYITINQVKVLVQIIDINQSGQLQVRTQNNKVLSLFNEEIILK